MEEIGKICRANNFFFGICLTFFSRNLSFFFGICLNFFFGICLTSQWRRSARSVARTKSSSTPTSRRPRGKLRWMSTSGTLTLLPSRCVCVCVCVCACVRACLRVCVRVCVGVYIRIYTYVYYVRLCLCKYAYVCILFTPMSLLCPLSLTRTHT